MCMYIYIYIHIYTYTCIYIYIYTCVVYVCIYTWMYIYIYIYTHICIYIYIYICIIGFWVVWPAPSACLSLLFPEHIKSHQQTNKQTRTAIVQDTWRHMQPWTQSNRNDHVKQEHSVHPHKTGVHRVIRGQTMATCGNMSALKTKHTQHAVPWTCRELYVRSAHEQRIWTSEGLTQRDCYSQNPRLIGHSREI